MNRVRTEVSENIYAQVVLPALGQRATTHPDRPPWPIIPVLTAGRHLTHPRAIRSNSKAAEDAPVPGTTENSPVPYGERKWALIGAMVKFTFERGPVS